MTIREYLQCLTLEDFKRCFEQRYCFSVKTWPKMFYYTVAKYATVYKAKPFKCSRIYLRMTKTPHTTEWSPEASVVKNKDIPGMGNSIWLDDKLLIAELKRMDRSHMNPISIFPISRVLDLEVTVGGSRLQKKSKKEIACLLFEEMTFNGFSDKQIKERIKQMCGE